MRQTRLSNAEQIDYAKLGWDPDLGTVRMGVRDYDATLGQFWTPDPLYLESLEACAKSPIDCNLYGYAKGNPLSWVDPEGTNPMGFFSRAQAMRNEGEVQTIPTTLKAVAGGTVVAGVIAAASLLCKACVIAVPLMFAKDEGEVAETAVLVGCGRAACRAGEKGYEVGRRALQPAAATSPPSVKAPVPQNAVLRGTNTAGEVTSRGSWRRATVEQRGKVPNQVLQVDACAQPVA